MFLPRIIPVLLLKGKGLVKSIKFKKYRYIGDPINAVKIFNDLKVDELIIFDIEATNEGRSISPFFIQDVGDEAFMPFGVGGGINSMKAIEDSFKYGAEKVIINTAAYKEPGFIENAAKKYGSQSVVVAIDVKKNVYGKYIVWIKSGTQKTEYSAIEYAKRIENLGAGEIIITSIDHDGTMAGYDLLLSSVISNAVNIPVVICGGAGKLSHLRQGYYDGGAHALAAGSIFVYHGIRNAVLINYPSKEEIYKLFNQNEEE